MNETQKPARRSRNFHHAITRLQDVLAAHHCYKGTSDELHQKFLALKNDFNLTQNNWEYLKGYYHCQTHNWRTEHIYCFVFNNEVIRMDWDKLTQEQRDYVSSRTSDQLESGHYWLNKDGSIGRPWFVHKPETK